MTNTTNLWIVERKGDCGKERRRSRGEGVVEMGRGGKEWNRSMPRNEIDNEN